MISDKKSLNRVDLIFSEYNVKYNNLERAYSRHNEELINELIESELKGRGGAGFLTGLKWQYAADEVSDEKYVICNADEGEPGTFKDKELLQKVPRKVFGGMAICGKIIGAKKGYIYLRGEYKYLVPNLLDKLDNFHSHIHALGYDFTIGLRLGSGAYVCGEETALIESMESKRGEPRNKPPYPIRKGLYGKPTVVNNVETFVSALMVFRIGATAYHSYGTKYSSGSKVFSVSGDARKEGVYELELGMTLDDFVKEFGDGNTKAVQVGGASGFCVPRRDFKKTVIGFEGIPTGGSMMIFNTKRSMYNVLHNFLDFFSEESCGQCTPCRVGCQQLLIGIEAIKKGEKSREYITQLLRLAKSMSISAKCGLGRSVSNSFTSIVTNFTEEILY